MSQCGFSERTAEALNACELILVNACAQITKARLVERLVKPGRRTMVETLN